MARRNRDLAGLAALGALGLYMARGGKQDGSKVPVDEAARRGEPSLEDLVRGSRDLEGGIEPMGLRQSGEDYGFEGRRTGPVASMPGRSAPARPASARSAGYKNPQRGPSYEEIAAYNRSSRDAGYAPGPSTSPARPGERVPSAATSYESTVTDPIAPGDFATEAALMFMPGPRVLRGAFRGAREAEAAAPVVRQLPGPTPRLTGPSKKSLVEEARAARAASRQEEMLRENAKRYGLDPNAPGYEGTARAVREQLGGGEFLLKKKGGMVKAKPKKMASGGMTSASKRADGIATKGKTKCKMY